MATIKGNFKFKDTPTKLFSLLSQELTFVSNGQTFVKITNEPVAAKVVSFTVSGTAYQAEENMTWETWVASEYNTVGYALDGDYIKYTDGSYISTSENYDDRVTKSQIIVADAIYSLATEVVEPTTVTIEAGTYVANFTSGPTGIVDSPIFDFRSNGTYYYGMVIGTNRILYIRDMGDLSGSLAYNFSGDADIMGWQNDAYKTITLDTDQTVYVDFGEWFNANFTKQTVSLISFTIDDTEYQAESGMTWGEWCVSSYNTGDWEVVGNQIVGHILYVDGVTPSDVIIDGHTYGCSAGSN